MRLTFSKVLARYYCEWYRDSYDSIQYCLDHNMPLRAEQYRQNTKEYFDLINEYWDEIEFFSIGDNAHYLPFATLDRFMEYCKLNPSAFPNKEEFLVTWCEANPKQFDSRMKRGKKRG